MKYAILAASAAALALAACQQESGGAADQQNQAVNAVQDGTSTAVGTVAAPAGAMTNEGFVTNAAIGGMYEVEAGKIAAERSGNSRIKSLASTMVTEHTRAGEALKAAATGFTVPIALDERRRGLIDNLRGASDQDFDKIYLEQQEAAHDETISLLQTYSGASDNAALKAFADQTLPVVRRHAEMIDALDEGNADTAH